MQIPIIDFLFWNRFGLLGIFRLTSIFILFFGFSRKLSKNGLRLLLLMLSTAFGFNSFPNTNLWFFGFNHLRFCFVLQNSRCAGETGLKTSQTGRGATGTFAFIMFPPSIEVLDIVSVLLLENFGLTNSA